MEIAGLAQAEIGCAATITIMIIENRHCVVFIPEDPSVLPLGIPSLSVLFTTRMTMIPTIQTTNYLLRTTKMSLEIILIKTIPMLSKGNDTASNKRLLTTNWTSARDVPGRIPGKSPRKCGCPPTLPWKVCPIGPPSTFRGSLWNDYRFFPTITKVRSAG